MTIILKIGVWALLGIAIILNSNAISAANHTQFEQLKGPFQTGPEVTRACLGCHINAAKQVQKTTHWTWEWTNPATGQQLGKKHVINNFCLGAMPNISTCSTCHIGYDWTDSTFDFNSEEQVDCLVCHETAGEYSKERLRDPGNRHIPLEKFAQSVGPTSRRTCGVCHFAGGGAIAVKHGDIDPSLELPDIFVDVHMNANGLNFSCATCHAAGQHQIQGSRYAPNAADKQGVFVPGRLGAQRAACQTCHAANPHPNNVRLNQHTRLVACQTCHIPRFSRGDYPTKTWWDWSTAGRLGANKELIHEENAQGYEIYNSKKGSFDWERDVIPEYIWFDGTVRYVMPGDKIDPTQIVTLNAMFDAPPLGDARIWPMKMMRGKQPYDKVNKTLVQPLTTTPQGYWTTFDWKSAIALGQQAVNQPFSGEYDFVETRMLWPINHMVAPKAESLTCDNCHTPPSQSNDSGRLVKVSGIYIPGQKPWHWLDVLSAVILAVTALAIAAHALLRFIAWQRRGGRLQAPIANSPTSLPKVYLFKRFERFWHWLQALLILTMLVTGFEIHGLYQILGFRIALMTHEWAAWILIGLWILAIFWHFVTGEWRQYLPTTKQLVTTLRFYVVDIFTNKPHPFKPTPMNKLNPVQRLAYLGLKLFLVPTIWISGVLLFFYNFWPQLWHTWLSLGTVALIHTAAAWMFALFLLLHLYMLTTGTSLLSHVSAMITGFGTNDEGHAP